MVKECETYVQRLDFSPQELQHIPTMFYIHIIKW